MILVLTPKDRTKPEIKLAVSVSPSTETATVINLFRNNLAMMSAFLPYKFTLREF